MANNFIDLFAGCGGLSLGLINSGWKGEFAIEKSEDAFATYSRNLCGKKTSFSRNWPSWLEHKAMSTSELLENHKKELRQLRGNIKLVVGGPPCQGFSFAGLRATDDPRNTLFQDYFNIVKLIQPKYILLENVCGIQRRFTENTRPYSEVIASKIKTISSRGYKVYSSVVQSSVFGVPQPRPRFILIAVRIDKDDSSISPFQSMLEGAASFRKKRGLDSEFVSVKEAIGDLEIRRQKLVPYKDNPNFKQIQYTGRRHLSKYQALMRKGLDPTFSPNSLRLPNHRPETISRFGKIQKECKRGSSLSPKNRKKYNLKKHSLTPLHPSKIARTVTTLPDDMIHYNEPRILTVRENARLQSFPDSFHFEGKYTTGGLRRRVECPRYTQVGNAVPPLLSEALGEMLIKL